MPTGYTAVLFDNPLTTFEQFAMRCARGFGALVHMRDHGLDAEIPDEIKPEPHYLTALHEAEARVRELETMTMAQAETCAAKEHARAEKAAIETDEHYAREQAIIDAMAGKVHAWAPPTRDHDGLKRFMLEQLEMSRPPRSRMPIPRRKTALEWLEAERAEAARSMATRAEQWRKEQESAAKATAWLRALRGSLRKAEKQR